MFKTTKHIATTATLLLLSAAYPAVAEEVNVSNSTPGSSYENQTGTAMPDGTDRGGVTGSDLGSVTGTDRGGIIDQLIELITSDD